MIDVKPPKGLRFTREHEWARLEDDGKVVVGVSHWAVDALGDIAFVEVPEVGRELAAGAEFGAIESVKSVSELYSPISGQVAAVNEELENAPELVNASPYGEGWIVRIQPFDPEQLDSLMTAEEYEAFLHSLE